MTTQFTLDELLADAEVFNDGDWVESKDQDPDGGVRLTQLADVGIGRWIDKSARFLTEEKAAELRCTYLKRGDLLVARMPDPIGRCCEYPGGATPAVTVVDVCVIRPNPSRVFPRYLMHIINSPGFSHQILQHVTGTTRQRISRGNLKKLSVPIPHKNGKPDLDEQKRIAAILEKADAIRRKRQQALGLTDDFLRSVFLDMFGDPVTNPKGWTWGELGDLVARLDGGKNLAEAPSETETRVLKVSAVTSGEYKPEESKFVPEDFVVPESYLVGKGDLLVSRANTRELIGATAYVWDTPENIMLPDKIWKFVWKSPDQVDPLFVHALTRFPGIQAEVGRRASGSSGSMKNIAKPKYMGVPIPIPPPGLQIAFGDIARKLRTMALRIDDPEASPDSLFSSLQQRAFRGEL